MTIAIIDHILATVANIHRNDEGTRTAGAEDAAWARDPEAIDRWGPLELRELVGRGGYGTVYRAWDPQLTRDVALKLLSVEHADARAFEQSVITEGRLLARVRHPNVIAVYGADSHDGRVGFQVENTLAAVGAAWSLGLTREVIRAGLESFAADIDHVPGRFNLLEVNGAAVVVDYGHNTSSLIAMLDALKVFPHEQRIAVYTAAGDRRGGSRANPGRTAKRRPLSFHRSPCCLNEKRSGHCGAASHDGRATLA
jgi:hypothetical protein